MRRTHAWLLIGLLAIAAGLMLQPVTAQPASTVVSGTVTADTEMPAAAAAADNTSNPTAGGVLSFNMCFDGSTWDRCVASLITEITEDVAETAGAVGTYLFSVRRDTAASSAGTTGDNATLNTDALGLLWTRSLDPCDGGEVKSVVSVDIVTATTTEIIDAVASENAYICAVNLVTAGANNVALVEDDTDACASPTAGMAGGTTAAEGWNLAANGGLTLGNGQGTVAKSAAANRNVCLITSAAVQLSGTVVYVTK